MLEALIKREATPGVADLTDVSAVVVRYFGGILLGAGGLVRAYSESVSVALDLAPLVQRRRLRLCAIDVSRRRRRSLGERTSQHRVCHGGHRLWSQACHTPHCASRRSGNHFQAHARLASLTSGNLELRPQGTEWVDLPR